MSRVYRLRVLERVNLLGDVTLVSSDDDVAVTAVGSRRSAIVLARLAVEAGTAVRSEALAATVWPEAVPDSWRAALRNIIADLRSSFGHGDARATIHATGTGYRLDLAAGVDVDVTVLFDGVERAGESLARGDAHGASAEAEAALPLLGRRFLDGDDSAWAADVRRRVDTASTSLVLLAGRAALATGQIDRAEQHARTAVAHDPLREDGHRLLVEALAASGNRAAALEAYDRCRTLLVERVGIEPSPSTQALFASLLADADDASPDVVGGPRPLVLLRSTTPFVGREADLARLDADLAGTGRGGATIVRVTGEAGIGKTRFAAELAGRWQHRGVAVLYGRADDRVDVPHRPLFEALDGHLAQLPAAGRRAVLGPGAVHLARVVPAIGDVVAATAPTGRPDLDRGHLLAALSEVVARIAQPAGAVLLLDDMQWSSRPTLDLVTELRDRLADRPVLVVLLQRTEAEGTASPAAPPTLELSGLTPTDIRRLQTVLSPPQAAPLTLAEAHQVWADTGGNPLYASEILRASALEPVDGRTVQRSQRLHLLVSRRLADLTPVTRRWLELAAVAGLEFDPALVSRAAGLTLEQAETSVHEAEAAGVVTVAANRPGLRSFRHALVRQCLLDQLGDDPAAAMRLHERLGATLERDDGSPAVRIAHHSAAAAPLGSWRRAVRYGLAAAEAAEAALVPDDVVALCRATLAVLDGAGDPDPVSRLRLEVMAGTAARALGDPSGEPVLLRAFEAALERGEPQLAAQAALGLNPTGAAGDEMAVDGRHVALYERALAALGDTAPHLRAPLLARLSTGYGWVDDGAAGRRHAEEALTLARAADDVATLTTVLVSTRRGLSGAGDPDRERTLEAELIALADRLDDPATGAAAWLWRFESAVEQGRGDELEPALREAERRAGAHPSAGQRFTAAYTEAARLLLRGDVEAADAAVEAAHTLGLDLGIEPVVCGGIRRIQLMGVRHEQGRLGGFRDELADFFGAVGVPEWRGGTVAFADAEVGRLDTVEPDLRSVFDGYATHGVRVGVGIGFAAHLARPVARTRNRELAEVLHAMLLPHTGQGGYISYFVGPVDYALGLTAATLGRTTDARRHLVAAAAFCERLGAPRWQERCEAALADLA